MDKTFKKLSETFPKEAHKEVSFGRGFITIDAYHIIARLTEVFGLCGLGWGVKDVEFETHGSCCVARGTFWYSLEGDAVGEIAAVGDASVTKGNIAEAYKKAQTNLISKAASYIGVGLSVYQGRGLDDPYLDREAEAKRPAPKTKAQPSPEPKDKVQKHFYDFEKAPEEKYPALVNWLIKHGGKRIGTEGKRWVLPKALPTEKFREYKTNALTED